MDACLRVRRAASRRRKAGPGNEGSRDAGRARLRHAQPFWVKGLGALPRGSRRGWRRRGRAAATPDDLEAREEPQTSKVWPQARLAPISLSRCGARTNPAFRVQPLATVLLGPSAGEGPCPLDARLGGRDRINALVKGCGHWPSVAWPRRYRRTKPARESPPSCALKASRRPISSLACANSSALIYFARSRNAGFALD